LAGILSCGLVLRPGGGDQTNRPLLFLAIPLYIFLGWRRKSIDTRRAVGLAAAFVAIMVAVFVFTNPFLFWASERKLALRTQITLHKHIAAGFTFCIITAH